MARITVVASGEVANVVIKRADGHELSLSSMGNGNMCEFNGSEIVNDYGDWNIDAAQVLATVAEFIAAEVSK